MAHIKSTLFAPAIEQLDLIEPDFIDGDIKSVAEARNRYGAAAELIARLSLDLVNIPINGRYKVCYDARCPRTGMNYEIKSVRLSQKIVLWKWRLEKEESTIEPLTYLIIGHKVRRAKTEGEMWQGFSEGVEIYIVNASLVHKLARECKLNPVNSEIAGHNREGYREGYYNLSWAEISSRVNYMHQVEISPHGMKVTCSLYGEFYLPEELR